MQEREQRLRREPGLHQRGSIDIIRARARRKGGRAAPAGDGEGPNPARRQQAKRLLQRFARRAECRRHVGAERNKNGKDFHSLRRFLSTIYIAFPGQSHIFAPLADFRANIWFFDIRVRVTFRGVPNVLS